MTRVAVVIALTLLMADPAAAQRRIIRPPRPAKPPATKAGPAKGETPLLEGPTKSPDWLPGYRFRWPLNVIGDPARQTSKTGMATLPSGGRLRADATDIAVQAADGSLLPMKVVSHDPLGDTLVQFQRQGNDLWYWAYGGHASPPTSPKLPDVSEGMSLEVRQWAGDTLASWADVRDGLTKSETVIGNAWVRDVIQTGNLAQPDQPRQFASSYRGTLRIEKDGVYRFLVNGDDATFLFIDGYKVFERPGTNVKLTGRLPINKIGNEIELKAGDHAIEVHHVVGNNPSASGTCVLLWKTAEMNNWGFVPAAQFVPAMLTCPIGCETPSGPPAPSFAFGVDDVLESGPVRLWLVQFGANGAGLKGEEIRWDFGDGSTGTGHAPLHVYFRPGTYHVKLSTPSGLTYEQRVHVWSPPGTTNPLALGAAVESLAETDWATADLTRVNQAFEFLTVSEQPSRWAVLEPVTRRLLDAANDPQSKAALLTVRITTLAEIGQAKQALELAVRSLPDYVRVASLAVGIKLAMADVYHRHLKDTAEATRRYQAILDDHRRLEHPNVRIAAIRWGDVYAEAGDLKQAAEAYQLAATLGGERFQANAQTEAVTRGALLRIAEQKLKSGDVRQCRQLLEKIELEYPEQKLEGLYRFLRAEADRTGGRYEEALKNYETLLRLTAWAGFRDKAMFGVADSYQRMGNYTKALEWLSSLKETFPRSYERQKLDDYRLLVEARLKHAEAGGTNGSVMVDFEPDEESEPGRLAGAIFAPSFGLVGPWTARMPNYPDYRGYYEYSRPVTGLLPGGNYWVEFWVRDAFAYVHPTGMPHVHLWMIGTGEKFNGNTGMGTIYYQRTQGRWFRLGFKVTAPLKTDAEIRMSIRHIFGVSELDGLSIRPMSDRAIDSLASFIEGEATP